MGYGLETPGGIFLRVSSFVWNTKIEYRTVRILEIFDMLFLFVENLSSREVGLGSF